MKYFLIIAGFVLIGMSCGYVKIALNLLRHDCTVGIGYVMGILCGIIGVFAVILGFREKREKNENGRLV